MQDKLTGWRLRAGLGISGAVAALGQAPFDLPFLALLGLASGMALALPGHSPRQATRRGWIFASGYFALTLHWIVEPFLVDIARHGWMAPFALVLLAGGMALFWALAFGAAAWTARGITGRVLALSAAMALIEMIRAVIFTGFPWGMLATIWTETPFVGLAAFIGPYGLVATTVLAAGGLTVAVQARGQERRQGALLAASVLGLGWFGGATWLAQVPGDAGAGQPVVRVVQPNAAQHLKWRSDMIPVFWQRKLDLTGQPAPRAPDVVVWPEVTLPYQWGQGPTGDMQVAAAAGGAPVIVGAQRFAGDELRNSIGVLGPGGAPLGLYDKFHLVPFGEYFPGGALARRLGLEGLATDALGGFSPGPGPQLLDLTAQGLGRVLPLICYEAIFPRHGFSPVGRADWIVQVTNDAWFGEFAGPQQHLAQARLRAVEQGLPHLK